MVTLLVLALSKYSEGGGYVTQIRYVIKRMALVGCGCACGVQRSVDPDAAEAEEETYLALRMQSQPSLLTLSTRKKSQEFGRQESSQEMPLAISSRTTESEIKSCRGISVQMPPTQESIQEASGGNSPRIEPNYADRKSKPNPVEMSPMI